MEYKPDSGGMQAILRAPQMRNILRQEAIKAMNMAKATAPRRSGKFATSIHVADGGLVEVHSQYGRVTRRAAMQVVASSPNAITVEFGGKQRYSRGLNREGHHTLGNVVKMLRHKQAVSERQALAQFRASGVSAAPGAPGSGQRASGKTR